MSEELEEENYNDPTRGWMPGGFAANTDEMPDDFEDDGDDDHDRRFY